MEKRRQIDRHAAPQKLHRAGLGAITFQDAGTSQFEQPRAFRIRSQHGRDVVFAGRVEAARALGIGIAHEAIGADHQGLAVFIVHRTVDDEKVVAEFVELVEIAAGLAHRGARDRRHLFVEDAITQTLRRFDFGIGLRKAHFERAHRGQHRPLVLGPFERARLVDVYHGIWRSPGACGPPVGRKSQLCTILPEPCDSCKLGRGTADVGLALVFGCNPPETGRAGWPEFRLRRRQQRKVCRPSSTHAPI